MASNWIITQDSLLPDKTLKAGDPINLDFLAKVQWGGDFMSKTGTPASGAKQRLLVFYHGIAGGTGTSGSTTAYQFKSPNLALAAKNKVMLAILAGVTRDLRISPVTIVQSSLPEVIGSDSQIIQLTGTGFSNDGKITLADSTTGDNTVSMPVGVADGGTTLQFVLDPGIPNGTYDIEYTDAAGNAAVLAKGLKIS